MTTITYKFQEAYLTPNPNELEKTLATITSEGDMFVSHYVGRKLISNKKANIKPLDFVNLITEMKKYERPVAYMDAVVSSAKITFDHGESITFNPAPWCITELISNVEDQA